MLEFIEEIKMTMEKKYNDHTIYDSRVDAMHIAYEYAKEVGEALAAKTGFNPQEMFNPIVNELPCFSCVRVWCVPGEIQTFNKNFKYKKNALSMMASTLLNEWFEKELEQRKECGIL